MTTKALWGLERPALGLALGGATGPEDWQRMVTWARRAEALGMHSLWLPEMHFVRGACSAPLMSLAGLAAHTRSIRLATTSLLLPIHDPSRLGAEIAALDHLSGGRTIIGLGRGFRAPLFRAFGIDAASKRDRFDAALDHILAAWDAALDAGNGTTGPRQRPHPPLAVAAFGKKGLTQAARRELPYLASPVEPIDQLAENLAYFRACLPDTARAKDLVVPIMRTVHVAANDAEAARVSAALESEPRPANARLPAALARAAASRVDERSIVGTERAVADGLARYREALGWDLLVVRPPQGGCSPTERLAALERLVTRVLPALT